MPMYFLFVVSLSPLLQYNPTLIFYVIQHHEIFPFLISFSFFEIISSSFRTINNTRTQHQWRMYTFACLNFTLSNSLFYRNIILILPQLWLNLISISAFSLSLLSITFFITIFITFFLAEIYWAPVPMWCRVRTVPRTRSVFQSWDIFFWLYNPAAWCGGWSYRQVSYR